MSPPTYPFSAVVGQDDLKLALMLNAVSPAIGGVLIRGEKGTAKSTAVRGLARLLPEIKVVHGCAFNCHPSYPHVDCPAGPHEDARSVKRPVPLVELPVGASADRVVGSLDIEQVLTEGRRAFEPGLLAAAHRGILYVDEVNLLPDHLVDLLLDAAALAVNHVERDGVSIKHPARFLLVGTMNPEEGELRPQLLDRFGITVEIKGNADPAERVEVVRRRMDFDADPEGFSARWNEHDRELAAMVAAARGLLGGVSISDELLERIARICAAFAIDGLRGDIVMAKTATALAAWADRDEVILGDVERAARLALPHRRRRGPFEQVASEDALHQALSEARGDDGDDPPNPGPSGGGAPAPEGEPAAGDDGSSRPAAEQVQAPGPAFEPIRLEAKGSGSGATGSRSKAAGERGHDVGDRPASPDGADLSIPATLRAAAPHQHARGRVGPGLVLRRGDLRSYVRDGREGNLVVFVVDASSSMGARRRMSAVKGAVGSLLLDAYRRRDKVAVVTFAGESAAVLLPPTSSVDFSARRLAELPVGGRTPLAAGLDAARELLASEALRDPHRRPLVVLLTDGRANAGGSDPVAAALSAARGLAASGVPALVVDTERAPYRLSIASRVAQALSAPCVALEDLEAGSLAAMVLDAQRRIA